MPKKKTLRRRPAQPQTTTQQLGSLIKSARDIMRKDKGLSGDLDRLPMLTWVMFLKFLDDMEQIEQSRAKLGRKKYKPAIKPPYRWRDWAANESGITGPELLAFINQEEAVRPDGTKGPGLFAYLRSLQAANGRGDRRTVVATVFGGVINRMTSGYLLRDVINKVGGIHFTAQEELFTLGSLYETMLKEMRDAAGDNGEFYTPRPVVRFMVEVLDPKIGETLLDPACGTGGFLVESYNHMAQQAQTVQHRKRLQEKSIFGGEAKPLPYLLCQMNLLLHGLEYPQIDPENSLRFPLNEIGDRDRVDVILTNPPFGGEEERGILGNFPEDKQTAETALLFLQLIMRKLRRPGHGSEHGGRAGVVVPNGTLYGRGVAEQIRRELLTEFNLRAVVRLPKGVFEPYTDIATNLLFFDRSGPTKKVCFYEHPLPPHRAHLKNQCYSATDGVKGEEFIPHLAWWKSPAANDQVWCVPVRDLLSNACDLALTHPKHASVCLPRPTELTGRARRIGAHLPAKLDQLDHLLRRTESIDAQLVKLRKVIHPREEKIKVQPGIKYRRPRVQLHFRGARVRDEVDGANIGTKTQTPIQTNDLIVSRIDARNGAMAIVSSELDGAIATNDFPVFEFDSEEVVPSYLRFALFQPQMLRVYERMSRGSTNRRRLDVSQFLDLAIPLPKPDMQAELANVLEEAENQIAALRETLVLISEEVDQVLAAALHASFEK